MYYQVWRITESGPRYINILQSFEFSRENYMIPSIYKTKLMVGVPTLTQIYTCTCYTHVLVVLVNLNLIYYKCWCIHVQFHVHACKSKNSLITPTHSVILYWLIVLSLKVYFKYFNHIAAKLYCLVLLSPPKKGAYYFATVGRSVCRSVGL